MDNVVVRSDVNKMLIALLGRWEFVDMWWTSSNVHFNFQTPEEVYYQEGGPRKVFEYVAGHCAH